MACSLEFAEEHRSVGVGQGIHSSTVSYRVTYSVRMPLIVIIPWRPQPSRVAAFDAVVAWYRSHFDDVEIRTIDSPDELFNLSQCRNLGIDSISDPDQVVIINDADTIPQFAALQAAMSAAASSGLVHLPYTSYNWLGGTGTAQFFEGRALEDCDYELVRGACSGVYVTTPSTWWKHGGQDETFRGWGFEDAAWYVAHETLLGAPPHRHEGTVFALHHVTQLREGPGYDANARHMERYREAASDREKMAQLVFTESTASRARILPGD